ncbi:MAG: cobalt-precorrin-7 (C(5))-methyltransferase, partial [Planctomycetia bacterium]|nr:cobalt-precorrin-7 (C(5))-methyltransferase [Planctomycetia bacterium]
MKVWLIGGGCGPATLTLEAKRAIDGAELLLGSQRLLADCPGRRTIPAYRPAELMALLEREGPERACVLYSGDTGFYSGALGLLPLLEERNIEYCLLPGISSLQVLSARVGRPWQDWRLCSAHGVALDPIPPVME